MNPFSCLLLVGLYLGNLTYFCAPAVADLIDAAELHTSVMERRIHRANRGGVHHNAYRLKTITPRRPDGSKR